jgi:hypothetical protein
MSEWGRLRDVVLETRAMDKHDDFEVELARFAEAWKALEWILCRSPEIGVYKSGGSERYWLYKQDTDIYALTPIITVLYTFNETQILIKDIDAKEADRRQHGTA